MYYSNVVLVQAPLKVDVGNKIFCTWSFTKRDYRCGSCSLSRNNWIFSEVL